MKNWRMLKYTMKEIMQAVSKEDGKSNELISEWVVVEMKESWLYDSKRSDT